MMTIGGLTFTANGLLPVKKHIHYLNLKQHVTKLNFNTSKEDVF